MRGRYANSLLYGLPQITLQRLQCVQNCAARLVSRTRKFDHITLVLQHLHWLPICVRPTYKVFLFAYSVMHDQAPCYIAELLSHRQPNRRLRSASLPLYGVHVRARKRGWGQLGAGGPYTPY